MSVLYNSFVLWALILNYSCVVIVQIGLAWCDATVGIVIRDYSRDVLEDNMVEAKAWGLRGQGHKILSSRCTRGRGQSSRTPILGQRAVMPSRLSVHHSQIQAHTATSCVLVYEVLFLWYWVLYLLTILKNSTSYGQISKPKSRSRIVKAKARDLQGQGHTIVSSRSRPVLEDPIPGLQ